MTSRAWTADVAGVAVAVTAADERYARCALDRLGAEESAAGPEVMIELGPRPPLPVAEASEQELENWFSRERDGVLWMGADATWARIEGARIDIGGSLDRPADEDTLDDLLQFALAYAVATPSRLMVHGAVVARGDEAALIVGPSGAGKSTLAAAALVGGWDLLGDDLAVVDTSSMRVRAVRRAPMVPADVAEAHALVGTLVDGARRRVRLPMDRLVGGERRLVGMIAVDHGDAGHTESLGPGDLEVLDDALAVPPFRAVIRRHLAAGAALVELPAVALAHAQDPLQRVERAIERLDEAWGLLHRYGQ